MIEGTEKEIAVLIAGLQGRQGAYPTLDEYLAKRKEALEAIRRKKSEVNEAPGEK